MAILVERLSTKSDKVSVCCAALLLGCTLLLGSFPIAVYAQEPATSDDPAKEQTESQSTEPKVVDHLAVTEVPPDEKIQTRLSSTLQATEWFEEPRIEVKDSVVFLDGVAKDATSKDWAEQLAHNTEGVAAVVNRLEVQKTFDPSQTLRVVLVSIKTLWEDFLYQSPLILAGILTLIFTGFASKIIQSIASRVAQRSRIRGSLQDLFLQLLTIAVWVMGLLVAAIIVFPGMTPSKALTVLGIGSVAVGFAFKDIFENFFAGVLILWKYPFDKGDFIECGDTKGCIEDITIRMTMIRQVDGQLIVVPNAYLFKNPVDVLTNRSSRRTTVICGVSYDTKLDDARDIIQKAVESCQSVRKDNRVEIFAQAFADSSINFEVTWWTGAKPVEERESRDEVVRAVKKGLDQAGIEIPFPQRTLWFPEPIQTQACGDGDDK